MNKYITWAAEQELHKLLQRTGGTAVYFALGRGGGLDFRVLFPGDAAGAIMLGSDPHVATDLPTLKALNSASIDFDDAKREFIFRLKRDELYSQLGRR